jgi:hypothetical protein
VLPDATLVLPASDGNSASEPWYAISLINDARPDQRDGFVPFAQLATDAIAKIVVGRPHWGKHNRASSLRSRVTTIPPACS